MFEGVLRCYLSGFPIEKGKWRVWEKAYPRIKSTAFPRHYYDLKAGFRMLLDYEQYIDSTLYYWGIWEPDESRALEILLRRGDSFIDVGANVGYFALLASGLVGSTGRVFAFEPVPATAEKLMVNIRANARTNIEIFEQAASIEAGTAKVSRLGVGEVSGQNTMRTLAGHTGDYFEVATTRIDETVPSSVDVRMIKLDVEGAELLALRGAESLLRKCHPILLCEVTDAYLKALGGSAAELCGYLRQLGYEHIYDCHGSRFKEVSEDFVTHQGQINTLFTQRPLADYRSG